MRFLDNKQRSQVTKNACLAICMLCLINNHPTCHAKKCPSYTCPKQVDDTVSNCGRNCNNG